MRGWAAIVVLVGCGRLQFEPLFDGQGVGSDADSGADSDATSELPEGLVAWYTFEDSGPDATDASGHGHLARCLEQSCPTPTAGRIGNGFAFSDARLDVSSTAELRTTQGFTVATWSHYQLGSPQARRCMAGKALGTANHNSWGLCVEADTNILFFSVTGAFASFLISNGTIQAEQWHHVAIRWDGTVKTIFIDGAQDPMTETVAIEFDDGPVRIGADIDSGVQVAPWSGVIDDLRIYDRALSDAEIAELAAQ